MKIKKNIRIREEDGFFLLINLDEKSILRGFPSFFKINKTARNIIDFMNKDVTEADVIRYGLSDLGMSIEQEETIYVLINTLKGMDLIDE